MTIFAVVLAIFCFVVGGAKLAGAKPLAEQFDEFGLGQNVMRLVGAAEIAAGIGLLLDNVAVFAAAGMVLMMFGALFHHRRVGHPAQAFAPAVAVLIGATLFFVLSV